MFLIIALFSTISANAATCNKVLSKQEMATLDKAIHVVDPKVIGDHPMVCKIFQPSLNTTCTAKAIKDYVRSKGIELACNVETTTNSDENIHNTGDQGWIMEGPFIIISDL